MKSLLPLKKILRREIYLWDPNVILVSLFQVLILQITRLIPFRKIRQMKLQLRELVKSIIGCWPYSPSQEGLNTTPKVSLILSSGHYLLIALNYSWQTPKWSTWTLIQLLPFPQFRGFFGMLFSSLLVFSTLSFMEHLPQSPLLQEQAHFYKMTGHSLSLVSAKPGKQRTAEVKPYRKRILVLTNGLGALCCSWGLWRGSILTRGFTAAKTAKTNIQKHNW